MSHSHLVSCFSHSSPTCFNIRSNQEYWKFRIIRQELFCKKVVPKNFQKRTGKHISLYMCPSIFIEKRVRHRRFPRNFLRKPVFIKHLCECVLNYVLHVPLCPTCLTCLLVLSAYVLHLFMRLSDLRAFVPLFLTCLTCPHF